MTSRMLVVRLLDWIFIGVTMFLLMGVAGLPMEWTLDLFDMSSAAFRVFGVVVVLASILLIHAIATSDPAT